MKEEWKVFKDAVLGCAREMYEVQKVGLGRGGKASRKWSEEVRELMKLKREIYDCLLECRSEIN